MVEADPERLAETAGPGAQEPLSLEAAAGPHGVDAVGRLERADEHGLRHALAAADEVEAPVDPVRPVDVGVAGRAEHRPVARRLTAKAVARRVLGVVGLDLHDASADAVDEERATDELGRDVHAPREELRASAVKQLLVFRRLRARLEQLARAAAEVAEVDPALLRVRGDPLGERERVVQELEPAAASWPMSWRIVRSVREAMMGAGMPSTKPACGSPSLSSPRIGSSA